MPDLFFDYTERFQIKARDHDKRNRFVTYETIASLNSRGATLYKGQYCRVYVQLVDVAADEGGEPEMKLSVVRKTCNGQPGSIRYRWFGYDEVGGPATKYAEALASGVVWAQRKAAEKARDDRERAKQNARKEAMGACA